jgi:hypothetical protein
MSYRLQQGAWPYDSTNADLERELRRRRRDARRASGRGLLERVRRR